jgi:RNA-binding protein YhbY
MSAPLSQAKKKHFRALGHKLNPVVTVAGRGLKLKVDGQR